MKFTYKPCLSNGDLLIITVNYNNVLTKHLAAWDGEKFYNQNLHNIKGIINWRHITPKDIYFIRAYNSINTFINTNTMKQKNIKKWQNFFL